jgi:hypothetical protein
MTTEIVKNLKLCSIPDDQKIINEYIKIKKNDFFNWTSFSSLNYKKQFFFFYLSFVLFFLPLFISFLNFFLSFKILSLCFLLFLFLVFFRWIDISQNFQKSRLLYEESSWFDTQIWEKEYFLIKKDRLINTQKLKPVIRRIFRTLLLLSFLFFFLNFC